MHNDLVPTSGYQSDKNQRYEESLITDVYHIHDRRVVMVAIRSTCKRYTCDCRKYDNLSIFGHHTRLDNLL